MLDFDQGCAPLKYVQAAGTAEWVKGKAAGVWSSVVAGTAAVPHKTADAAHTVTDKVRLGLGSMRLVALVRFDSHSTAIL